MSLDSIKGEIKISNSYLAAIAGELKRSNDLEEAWQREDKQRYITERREEQEMLAKENSGEVRLSVPEAQKIANHFASEGNDEILNLLDTALAEAKHNVE